MKHSVSSSVKPVFHSRAGVTLLELSIVLIVIGLIVGGILTGQDLIRSAEIRGVIEEVGYYRSQFLTFRTKYKQLPGDLNNATQIWGEIDPDPTTCRDTDSTGLKTTCNGDGDGHIESPSTSSYEMFRAWQHLVNAELISGSYTGIPAKTPLLTWRNSSLVGSNCPASQKMDGVGYGVRWVGSQDGTDPIWYVGEYRNVLFSGNRKEPASSDAVNDVYLTPDEAEQIDEKTDDGLPGSGNTRSYTTVGRPDCATSDDPATARYKVDTPYFKCNLLFIMGF